MISTDEMIGMSETDAINKLNQHKINYRIVKKNGQPYIVTRDLVKSRFNLTIEHDIITQITLG